MLIKPYHPKSKNTSRKRNLVQLTSKPDRSKLVKPRKVNMQKFPASTISQINWKSMSCRSHAQQSIDVACSTLSSLTSVQGCQLLNKNLTPPSSPTASTQAKEDPRYCTICTPLGKECPGRLATSDLDDDEDYITKEKEEEQPEASPKLAIDTPTQTLQPPKPCITRYLTI